MFLSIEKEDTMSYDVVEFLNEDHSVNMLEGKNLLDIDLYDSLEADLEDTIHQISLEGYL